MVTLIVTLHPAAGPGLCMEMIGNVPVFETCEWLDVVFTLMVF